jgi:GNAT superfamily N-acetyltransferase
MRVVDYKPRHHESFRALNLAWITKYFSVEDADRKALDDPENNILRPGGAIIMAEVDGESVGTCALVKCADGAYELAKMAVAPSAQGRGVGRALGEAAIARARSVGASRVELLSNTSLAPALALYRSLGFVEVPLPKTDYRRANIKMVLDLSRSEPRNGTRV